MQITHSVRFTFNACLSELQRIWVCVCVTKPVYAYNVILSTNQNAIFWLSIWERRTTMAPGRGKRKWVGKSGLNHANVCIPKIYGLWPLFKAICCMSLCTCINLYIRCVPCVILNILDDLGPLQRPKKV